MIRRYVRSVHSKPVVIGSNIAPGITPVIDSGVWRLLSALPAGDAPDQDRSDIYPAFNAALMRKETMSGPIVDPATRGEY
jgi:hypothetical protein